MTEQYNHVFVWRASLSEAELLRVTTVDLTTVWQVFGQPADLLKLNVGEGTEEHINLSHGMQRNFLERSAGTILSIRGADDRMGTVQYYELANFGAITVSRPLALQSPQQRLDWMKLLWSKLQPQGVAFAVSGREVEIEASDAEAGLRDWRRLRGVPLAELLILSQGLVPTAPAEATPVANGWLIQLQSDTTGGRAMH